MTESFYEDFLELFKTEEKKKKLKKSKHTTNILEFIKIYFLSVELFFIIALTSIAALLGFIGYSMKFPHIKDPFYLGILTARLFILEFDIEPPIPLLLKIAMVLCPLILAYSTIRTITIIFRNRLKLLLSNFANKHVVICGLNKRSMYIIKQFRKNDEKVIVIDKDKNNEYIAKCKELGVLVMIGNCTDRFILRRVRVHYAKYLISIESDDSINMEVGILAYERLKKRYGKKMDLKQEQSEFLPPIQSKVPKSSRVHKHKLRCFIHIKDIHLQALYSPRVLFHEGLAHFELKIFNIYENCARCLFYEFEIDKLVDTKTDGVQVHLLVIGFGEMGESVVLQAVRQAHYANEKKVRITIIDRNIEELKTQFEYRYPAIHDVCDIQYEALDIKNIKIFNDKLYSIENEHPITAIIICFNDKNLSIMCALTLPIILKDRKIDIRVELEENEVIFKYFETYPIKSFGLFKKSCSREIILNETLDLLSREYHEYYRKKELNKLERQGKKFEDLSKKEQISLSPWDQLPVDLKNSNRQLVDHTFIKLRAIDCDIVPVKGKIHSEFVFKPEELELLARIEHNRWVTERLLSGWTYGETKDVKNKKSPFIKPFDKLTSEEQRKDFDFIKYIPQLLAFINLGIQRK